MKTSLINDPQSAPGVEPSHRMVTRNERLKSSSGPVFFPLEKQIEKKKEKQNKSLQKNEKLHKTHQTKHHQWEGNILHLVSEITILLYSFTLSKCYFAVL